MHTASHQSEVTPPPDTWRRSLMARIASIEPRTYRGPFTRWPHITDGALAAAVFAGSLIAVSASALQDGADYTIGSITDLPAGAFVLLAVAAAALLWRRQRPVAVAVLVSAITIGWATVGYGDGGDGVLIVAVYAVGRYATNHIHSLGTVAVAMAVDILGTIIDTNQRIDIAPAAIVIGVAWYVGRRVRNRGDYMALLQERAERLEADQRSRARQAVADERSRIARELHDVVAHQVSMMTVQAGAAKTIARDDIDTAIDAMGDVESAGRQALGELRHLLGVLRPDSSGGDDLSPQPGLTDIASLADQLTRLGADVSLTIAPVPADLPAAIGLSAYRIVQESLTNIIKHAGPKPTVHISVALDDSGLVIDVVNTITETAESGLPTSGYGIAGMSERAALLGGTLSATPQAPDRFCVRARIPLELGKA